MFMVGKKCLDRVQKIFDDADKDANGTVNVTEAMQLLKVKATKAVLFLATEKTRETCVPNLSAKRET